MGNPPSHDDVIKWKHFPRYWPFVRGIHRWPMNSPHKVQWRDALMLLWSAPWVNGWVNNREAGDLRRHCAHYDVIVMSKRASNAKNEVINILSRDLLAQPHVFVSIMKVGMFNCCDLDRNYSAQWRGVVIHRLQLDFIGIGRLIRAQIYASHFAVCKSEW